MQKVDPKESLQKSRLELRKIDDRIFADVNKRMQICYQIGKIKQASNLDVTDLDQEQKNAEHNARFANESCPPEMISELTNLLIKWSKKIQKNSL
jgi:chorismate mutase